MSDEDISKRKRGPTVFEQLADETDGWRKSPEQQAADKLVEEISYDGGLGYENPYIEWNSSHVRITLSGDFTPHQLIALANHMLRHSK